MADGCMDYVCGASVCETSCMSICSVQGGSCASDCSGGCGNTCVGGCVSECGNSCSTSCGSDCDNSCGACLGTCYGTCNNGCSGGNYTTAYNTIKNGFSDIMLSTEIIALRELAWNERSRRDFSSNNQTNTESQGDPIIKNTLDAIYANLKKASSFSLTIDSDKPTKANATTLANRAKTLYNTNIYDY